MVILLSGNEMYLPWSEKMYAVALYRKRFEIDHMTPCSIDKKANLVICVAVGLLRLMRVLIVFYCLPFHFIHMKGDLLIALW